MRWHLKSPVPLLFAQQFVQVQIKENIKVLLHWPLWGESTGDWWIPNTKGQWWGKCFHLTLNVRGPSYLGLTRSITWLLMPWLLASPGHQQPRYWLCRIGRSWSYSRRNFNNLCLISLEQGHYLNELMDKFQQILITTQRYNSRKCIMECCPQNFIKFHFIQVSRF